MTISFGFHLVTATALATGLVVASWTGRASDKAAAPAVGTQSAPSRSAIDACNEYAAGQPGQRDKTGDAIKDVEIGAIAGTAGGGLVGAGSGMLYGLDKNQKHDERYRGAYAACMRSRGYTGSPTAAWSR